MRERLSVTVITKNEEKRIGKCLESAAFADEILVVDSGSTDRTIEIARQHGARIIQQAWLGYGRQKQFAVDQAKNDWVLSLDADEWLSEELSFEIKKVLTGGKFKAYEISRRNKFLGRWLRYGEGYPDRALRLFKKSIAVWSTDVVHEKVIARVRAGRLSGDLMHESEDGLRSFVAKQAEYARVGANNSKSRNFIVLLVKIVTSPAIRFLKNYIFRFGFMDGYQGFIFAVVMSWATVLKYTVLLRRNFLFSGGSST
jgi:glycosyltransferase involved in cell wall biosynthesis